MVGELALKHDLLIISDEIYEKLLYDGQRHISIASLSEELKARTIVVNGLSKSHSMTGWRIGYAAGPKEIISAMTKVQGQSTSNPTSIAQWAAVEALKGPQDFIEEMLREFDRRRKRMVQGLNEIQGISAAMPKGAFYVFANVKGLLGKKFNGKTLESSTDLGMFLLEVAKVAAVSGAEFGAEGYIRFSYATSLERIEEGLNRIAEAVKLLQ
jgi:aspartate aminotransferase